MAAISVEPGPIHFGDKFSFTWQNDTGKHQNDLWIICEGYVTHNGSSILVYSDVRSAHEGGYGYLVPFQAGPTARWSEGPADMLGKLGYQGKRGFRTIAECEFEVLA